jgi:hypothetical protein
MEGKAEPEVRFVPHEQFDSAPLPVNKFRWPYVYLYVAICKVSACLLVCCRSWQLVRR